MESRVIVNEIAGLKHKRKYSFEEGTAVFLVTSRLLLALQTILYMKWDRKYPFQINSCLSFGFWTSLSDKLSLFIMENTTTHVKIPWLRRSWRKYEGTELPDYTGRWDGWKRKLICVGRESGGNRLSIPGPTQVLTSTHLAKLPPSQETPLLSPVDLFHCLTFDKQTG